ncbi:hypothetical protein [Burkholderia sp. D-99]|uniref:hypothetical protein n=1 Tax=Burkholderia sp. D-99 TaxID=2717316 RepID=UPI00141FD31F|nr:hypothetical protein [Burkholderia sp. D-99]NHV28784.1 hypothetical protein [Burkholderia sp. D-99]
MIGGRGNQRIAIEETRSSEAVTTLAPNPGSGNQFKMLGAVRHGIVNQAPIEGRQLALVSTSERRQVHVSVSRADDSTRVASTCFPSSTLTSSGQKVCPEWAGRCTTSGETAAGKPIVFWYFGFQII